MLPYSLNVLFEHYFVMTGQVCKALSNNIGGVVIEIFCCKPCHYLFRVLHFLPNYPFCRIFLYLSYTLRILNSDYFLLYILITHLHSLFLKFHNSVTTVIQQFFSSFFRIIFTRHFSTLPSKQYSLLYYLSI